MSLHLANGVRAKAWLEGDGKLGKIRCCSHMGSSLRKIGVVISGLQCQSFIRVLCSVAGGEDAAGCEVLPRVTAAAGVVAAAA